MKILRCAVALTLCALLLAGCGRPDPPGTFDLQREIVVVTREDGSGTRGAFIELFGIQTTDADGKVLDATTPEASVTNSTSVTMATVINNKYAIGYISMGSLDTAVKALRIDGVAPTLDTVRSGEYKVARPFNIVVSGAPTPQTQDFIAFILSAEGQAVVEATGYVSAVPDAPGYTASGATGKVVVAGSSSVAPVMEKLKEAYIALNPGVAVEIQQSDSTTGITAVADGICDIGMASRALKESERQGGAAETAIAIDGIALIVNPSARWTS